MLGTLQTDMSRQGVSTTKKGTCAACNKPIVGQVCTALGRTWHPEHFTCIACELPLGNKNFFERDGKPYCEKDYHDAFAPRCAYCNGPILEVNRLSIVLWCCTVRAVFASGIQYDVLCCAALCLVFSCSVLCMTLCLWALC